MTAADVRWQSLRRVDIARLAAEDATVVVPTGSIEQHGDHLPLDTDSLTAETVALLAAERVRVAHRRGAHRVVGRVRATGWASRARSRSRPRCSSRCWSEIVSAIAAHGFRRVLLLNGHAGNTGALQGTCVRMAAQGVRICAAHYWSFAGDALATLSRVDGGRIGHAGEIETSLQLHLRPDRVGPLPADGTATRMPALRAAGRVRGRDDLGPRPRDRVSDGRLWRPVSGDR